MKRADNGTRKKGIDANVNLQPSFNWTPCEKQLPERAGDYFVTAIVYSYDYKTERKKPERILLSARFTKTNGWHFNSGKVIAWMPLPEPYKGEG